MIAASEEFLREIAPFISDCGELAQAHLHYAAIHAWSIHLPLPSYPGYVSSRQKPDPIYWLLCVTDTVRHPADNIDFVSSAVRDAIKVGMPFVGWSINADSRRISGPAQPGEGEFIKYFGRDE